MLRNMKNIKKEERLLELKEFIKNYNETIEKLKKNV